MAALNANAAPFSPKPTYPDTYPGVRNVSSTPQNSTPELARSTSTPSIDTLESDYVRNLWPDNRPRERQYASKPAPLPIDRPLYSDNNAVAEWLLYSSSALTFPQDPLIVNTAQVEEPLRGDVFVDGYTAEPYIPLVIRKRASVDPIGCSLGRDIPWGENHLWTAPMRKGCSQEHYSTRETLSATVTSCGPWNALNISQLAGMICEHAVQDSGPIPSYNALFARQLYERFLEIGPLPASLFQNQLMQAVFGEFKAYWTPARCILIYCAVLALTVTAQTMSSAIPNLPTCSPSPPHAHPIHHLSSALSIASYLGDLFMLGLVNGKVVLFCLRLLIGNMATLEQLQAAHSLITHCGIKLPIAITIPDVFVMLCANALNIAPNASAVGNVFDTDYVEQYVQVCPFWLILFRS